MGEGLKRVAKQCGGLKASDATKTFHYDEDGNIVKITKHKKSK